MDFGFLGLGNMAGAIIEGMHRDGGFAGDRIYGFNRSSGKTARLAESCGLIPRDSAEALVSAADVIVLAVKPQVLPQVMGTVAEGCRGKAVVTIAAGKSLEWYAGLLPEGTAVIRVMPNINAKVGSAVSAVCANRFADEETVSLVRRIFASVGRVYEIEERMFPAFSAIGGASGAFICLYIDALADAGVRAGFPRPFAVELATETVLGTARLASQSGEHPIALMNKVCSPGGTTIEGVLKLKELGFETAVQQGIAAIIAKDMSL